MTTHDSGEPTEPTIAEQASRIAEGSAVVMMGGIAERGLRMVTTWFLSGALGVVGFGLFTLASTVVALLMSFAPLGTDAGITMFGARYRVSGERKRLKGALLSALLITAIAGPAVSVLAWLAVRQGWVLSDRPIAGDVLAESLAAVALGALLTVVVGALVSAKDMVGQAVAQQIVLPSMTLLGALIAVFTGQGLDGVIVAFVTAHGIALLVALRRLWSRDGALLADSRISPRFELGTLMEYALPQSLARTLYRANLWVDILMLTALATLADVGVYRVSVALAMLGALPVMASTTMFGPVVAELVYTHSLDRLNALLKIVTRWLIIVAVPLYLGVLLLSDVILAIFDPAYLVGAQALGVLMAGQAIYLACAPTGACLTNAGYSKLNLLNVIVAVGLNLGLNYTWIPEHGIMGAAAASATALSIWSLMRVIEVRHLLQCSPLSARTVAIVLGTIGLGLALHVTVGGQGMAMRVAVVCAAIAVGLGLLWRFGRTPEDDAVLDVVRARLAALRS